MNLIKMSQVVEIIGLSPAVIRQKVAAGTFPKPAYNAHKIHKWDEKAVVRWFSELEDRIMRLNKNGYTACTIATKVNSNTSRITKIIEGNGGTVNAKDKPVTKNFFNLVLQTSAQLTNNRGIKL